VSQLLKKSSADVQRMGSKGKDGHSKKLFPAVFRGPGFNGHEEDEVLSIRRHGSTSLGRACAFASSQGPFAEVVWHP